MKYANDVASVVVLTAGLSLLVSLPLFPPLSRSIPSSHFSLYSLSLLFPSLSGSATAAKTTGGALNDAPATLSTSYAMDALQGQPEGQVKRQGVSE